MEKNILIVDDDSSIRNVINFYLHKEGFSVFSAENGSKALDIVEEQPIDLILLDVMLPDINGVDLCSQLRKDSNIPILFLSCKQEEIDKIMALSAGGDDYITKPFLPGELVARIKANIRRNESTGKNTDEQIYEAPGMVLNNTLREVYIDGKEVPLTTKEFDILLLLLKNPRRIYSAEQLFEYVWKENSLKNDKNTIMVYISNLRKKIDNNDENRKYILSIRNLGYKFNHHLFDGDDGDN